MASLAKERGFRKEWPNGQTLTGRIGGNPEVDHEQDSR